MGPLESESANEGSWVAPWNTNPDPCLVKPPPLNRDYNRDPNIWALKGGGVLNSGSTLGKICY